MKSPTIMVSSQQFPNAGDLVHSLQMNRDRLKMVWMPSESQRELRASESSDSNL
jgi:hypothetical protein